VAVPEKTRIKILVQNMKKNLNYCSSDVAPFQGFQIQFVDFLAIQRHITATKSTKGVDGVIDHTDGMSMDICRRHYAGHNGL